MECANTFFLFQFLTCKTTGIPPPEVRWRGGGQESDSEVLEVESGGEFVCQAENEHGREERTVKVQTVR